MRNINGRPSIGICCPLTVDFVIVVEPIGFTVVESIPSVGGRTVDGYIGKNLCVRPRKESTKIVDVAYNLTLVTSNKTRRDMRLFGNER